MSSARASRCRSLIKNYEPIIGRSSWAVAGQAVTALMTLAGTRAITQFLDPGVYGTVNLAQNAVLLLRNLLCSPLFNVALRFHPEAERGGYLTSLKRVLAQHLTHALIAVEALILLIGLLFLKITGITAGVVAAMCMYAAADIARTLEVTLYGAAQRQREVALLTSLETFVRPALVVLGVVLFGVSVSISLGAMALSIVVTLVVIYGLFSRRDAPGDRAPVPVDVYAGMKQFAIPLIPVALLNWTTSLSDRYIIEWVTHDAGSIGLYAAGYGLTSAPLMVMNGVILMILRPIYFAAEAHQDHDRAERIFRAWALLTFLACVIAALSMSLTREFLVGLLLGPKYRGAGVVIPWIALGYVFYALEQVFEQKLLAKKRSAGVLTAQTAGAVASIAVTIPLVIKFGMQGAAYACPVYFSIQCAVAAAILRTRFPR